MAQRVQTKLVDDIDGSEADGTVRFALDGQEYEIDLSAEHADQLRSALATFVSNGRRLGRTGGRQQGRAASSGEVNPKEVRAWAESQGIEYNKRGRLNRDLVARYQEAQGR